jgi:hypothetical protein
MKKITRSNPINKYNKLFKFLNFDQSLLSSFLITAIILLYAFAIMGLFLLLDTPTSVEGML